MLADEVDYVIGVDTHRDQHTLAVVAAPTGAVVAQTVGGARTRAATRRRCASRTSTRAAFASGRSRAPATTAPGSTRYLGDRGETVLEVGRTAAASGGCAARTTRSTRSAPHARRSRAETLTLPRAGERQEALRVLLLARRSAVDVRRVALVQLRSVIVTAPEQLREELRRLPVGAADPTLQPLPPLAARAHPTSSRSCSRCARSPAGSRPRPRKPTSSSARSSATSARSCRELLDEPGVGPIVAAQLIVTWSHHDRVRSEAAFARLAGVAPLPASSGQTIRHRLSRGGDRQLNRALHTVILHRRQHDPATTRLHRPPRRRRQNHPRRHPHPQALPRPPPLPRHAERDAS